MKTGKCECGAKIFFSNTKCVTCEAVLGYCELCECTASFGPEESAVVKCSHCKQNTKSCSNRLIGVCNSQIDPSVEAKLCEFCVYTEIVPSLAIEANVAKLKELERAKRQLIVQLQRLGLPPQHGTNETGKPLRFRFLSDTLNEDGTLERVFTGHEDGIITINIQEADSVYREKIRLELNEPQRTLIGHLRHEYGHYLDWCLPENKRSAYIQLFGDPLLLTYDEAKEKYYAGNRETDWREKFVSEYASMHPWEDFAETTNLYLDMLAVAITASQSSLRGNLTASVDGKDFQEIARKSMEIAIIVSEFNADLGLSTLLPENISNPVLGKLAFIHSLRTSTNILV
jgi:hypothetical protein